MRYPIFKMDPGKNGLLALELCQQMLRFNDKTSRSYQEISQVSD